MGAEGEGGGAGVGAQIEFKAGMISGISPPLPTNWNDLFPGSCLFELFFNNILTKSRLYDERILTEAQFDF